MLLPSAEVLFSDKLVRIKCNRFNSTSVAQPMSTAWSEGSRERERERKQTKSEGIEDEGREESEWNNRLFSSEGWCSSVDGT